MLPRPARTFGTGNKVPVLVGLLLSDELLELASVEPLAAGLTHLASFVPKSVLLLWGELQERLHLVEILGSLRVPLQPSDYR